jgi:hypothetical protein
MKHITYSDKSLMVGDEAADTLLAYAAALADAEHADTVTLAGIGATGENVDATFLLDAGSNLMAESVASTLPEPDNAEVVARMKEAMELRFTPPHAVPEEISPTMPGSLADEY